MELKSTDIKLLSYLYHHYREPVSKIAKDTNLTREQVEYRLSKYQQEGIIKGFFTMFNYESFGYSYFVAILLKFEKTLSKEQSKKLFSNSKNIISRGEVYGKYDVYLNAVFEDEKSLNEFISNLLEKNENPLKNYYIIKPTFAELYPLKLFKNFERDPYLLIGHEKQKRKFDKKEIEILKTISNNGRSRLVDIASKCNISSELALHKLRKLKEDKVILGSRIQFDMEKLGYNFTLLMLNIQNLNEPTKNKIQKFAKTSPLVNSLIFSLSWPNCIIQLFHSNDKDVRSTITQIREILKDHSLEIEVIPIGDEEDIVKTLPFL